MKRRDFLAGLGALPLAAMAASSSTSNDGQVTPWASVDVKEDKYRVIEFFSFSCNFCRQLDQGISDWGKSLPSAIKFEQIPFTQGPTDQLAAYSYYAAKLANSNLLPSFIVAAYELILGQGMNPMSPATFKEAARLSGYNVRRYESALFMPEIVSLVQRAADATRKYGVEYTPSIGIGGKFTIHSGHTNGDYSQLLMLANGLISRIIEGKS